MVSNIYLKFSELTVLDKEDRPFSNSYDDIAYAPTQDLVAFIKEKGKNCFNDPHETAKLLQKATRDSYA